MPAGITFSAPTIFTYTDDKGSAPQIPRGKHAETINKKQIWTNLKLNKLNY